MFDSCVGLALRSASRKLTAHYDAALAPAGVSLAQLMLLRRIGQHEPLSLGRLAPITGLDRSTLGRNVRVLKRLGLVTIRPGADLRQAQLRLSELGQQAFDRAMPLWEEAEAAIRQRLGAAGVAQLEAALAAL
jgi:DNA-binding MarR family transcriptional regulator